MPAPNKVLHNNAPDYTSFLVHDFFCQDQNINGVITYFTYLILVSFLCLSDFIHVFVFKIHIYEVLIDMYIKLVFYANEIFYAKLIIFIEKNLYDTIRVIVQYELLIKLPKCDMRSLTNAEGRKILFV